MLGARRIFTERIPEIAAPWARKTVRLVQRLEAMGLALGGAAGARLSRQVGSGAWKSLYRATDSQGNTLDFMLSAKPDGKAAVDFP